MTRQKIKRKIREWLLRYGPAEVLGTITALSAALIVHGLTNSAFLAALAGSIGESAGYYGYFGAREVRIYYKAHAGHPKGKRMAIAGGKASWNIMLEFGPAEIVDSLFVRPYLMYALPATVHNFGVGIALGKLGADIVFYGIAILSYEGKKYLSRRLPSQNIDATDE